MEAIEIGKLILLILSALVSLLFCVLLRVKANKEKKKAEEAKTDAERLAAENRALELNAQADELIEDAIKDVEHAFKSTGIVNGVAQKNGVLKKRLVMSEAKSFLASHGAKIDDGELSKTIDDKVEFMNTNKK